MNVMQEHQPLRVMINHGREWLDVGDLVWVKLVHPDPERGFHRLRPHRPRQDRSSQSLMSGQVHGRQ